MAGAAFAYHEDRQDYEVINGQVYMMARPSINHSQIQSNIHSIFRSYLRGKRCRAFEEVDVFLGEDNVVPDVTIVCNPDIIEDKSIHGVPDLIVEILSPSTGQRDKIDKKELYEKFGVKEYWIVDPLNKSVEVYLLKEGILKLDGFYMVYPDYEWKTLTDEQKAAARLEIKTSLYEDFYVKLDDIFEDVK